MAVSKKEIEERKNQISAERDARLAKQREEAERTIVNIISKKESRHWSENVLDIAHRCGIELDSEVKREVLSDFYNAERRPGYTEGQCSSNTYRAAIEAAKSLGDNEKVQYFSKLKDLTMRRESDNEIIRGMTDGFL